MGYRRLGVAYALALVLVLATVAGGCAGPLVVSAAQSRGSNVKFGYTRMGSGDQGIISCDVPEGGGDVNNCRHMTINFQE